MQDNKQEEDKIETSQDTQDQTDEVQEITETQDEIEAQTLEVQPQKELPKKLIDQVKSISNPIPGKFEKLRTFITECHRVLRITKKPDREELMTIVKISALGMAVIGLIGFLIHLAKETLF